MSSSIMSEANRQMRCVVHNDTAKIRSTIPENQRNRVKTVEILTNNTVAQRQTDSSNCDDAFRQKNTQVCVLFLVLIPIYCIVAENLI